jgi:Complex I intermediate-associated protein 30 (CIA30)
LDITTLGGAGFASQRTTLSDKNKSHSWDLSSYDGIILVVLRDKDNTDEKVYTFILKDEISDGAADSYPYTNLTGGDGGSGIETGKLHESDSKRQREPATLSWEYDFRVSRSGRVRSDCTDMKMVDRVDANAVVVENAESAGQGSQEMKENLKDKEEAGNDEEDEIEIFIPWASFKPTYRGKEKRDAKPIDLKAIRRMSLMMRRYASPISLHHSEAKGKQEIF